MLPDCQLAEQPDFMVWFWGIFSKFRGKQPPGGSSYDADTALILPEVPLIGRLKLGDHPDAFMVKCRFNDSSCAMSRIWFPENSDQLIFG
jgi:hypothetical protein